MMTLQAPVPFLNRALASEQLGVEAASSGRQQEAQQHYKRAVAVSADLSAPALPTKWGILPSWHSSIKATCSRSYGRYADSLVAGHCTLHSVSTVLSPDVQLFSPGLAHLPPCS